MKLTQSRLRQIIKEELQRFVESPRDDQSLHGYTTHSTVGDLAGEDRYGYDDDFDDDPYGDDLEDPEDYPDMPPRRSAYDLPNNPDKFKR